MLMSPKAVSRSNGSKAVGTGPHLRETAVPGRRGGLIGLRGRVVSGGRDREGDGLEPCHDWPCELRAGYLAHDHPSPPECQLRPDTVGASVARKARSVTSAHLSSTLASCCATPVPDGRDRTRCPKHLINNAFLW